jgi:uncharacterized protein (DUF362 family)
MAGRKKSLLKPPLVSKLSRRDFLQVSLASGAGVALASLLEGCSRVEQAEGTIISPSATLDLPTPAREKTRTSEPTQNETEPAEPTSSPSETPDSSTNMETTKVAFVRTKDRSAGVRKAIDLLGINPVENKRVFLKPNFNSADPAPGSTHLDVLTSLVLWLKEMGAQQIKVGDRSGMGDTRQVMDQLGVFRLAEELGFETVIFDELEAQAWVMVQPPGSHWKNGFPFARPCLEAEALVQTCCLKTHRYGGHFTLSLKNSVGMAAKRYPSEDYNFMEELHSSPHQRRMIAEINTAYSPFLVILDGVEAFISGGPDAGERVSSEVILAGTDRVAIDVVGIALLRYWGCKTEVSRGKIFEQEQIATAVDLGLGVDSPDKIEFLTGDENSASYSEEIRQILLAG